MVAVSEYLVWPIQAAFWLEWGNGALRLNGLCRSSYFGQLHLPRIALVAVSSMFGPAAVVQIVNP